LLFLTDIGLIEKSFVVFVTLVKKNLMVHFLGYAFVCNNRCLFVTGLKLHSRLRPNRILRRLRLLVRVRDSGRFAGEVGR
jgi:hypothetical protein